MSTETVEITLPGLTGFTLTAKLYADGSDTLVDTIATLTEATNRKCTYTGTTATGATGLHLVVALEGTTVRGEGYVTLRNSATGVTVAGSRADSFSSTLLDRITSTLFSGITSIAQWLGLMAGKQVGNSTARTEIRATGAGSGTYDETTDSLEAIIAEIEEHAVAGVTVVVQASSVAAVAALDSGQITIVRYSTYRARFTTSSLAGRTGLKFTLKSAVPTLGSMADAESLIQIDESAGLVIVNGSTVGVTSANGSITYVDDTHVDVFIDETVTGLLTAGSRMPYSIKMLNSAGDDTEITSVDYPGGAQTLARVLEGVSRTT